MKLNDLLKSEKIDVNNISPLSKNSFANLFNVVNKGENSYFNICSTINFKNVKFIDPSLYSTYTVLETDCWTGISYKFYETVELWWLICKFNDIKNPFTELNTGRVLKIPGETIKNYVLDMINNI
jgi:hypothetical protein